MTESRNEALLRLGVKLRGNTGCDPCDQKQYLFCKCDRSKKGGKAGGGTEGKSTDETKAQTNEVTRTKTSDFDLDYKMSDNLRFEPRLILSFENVKSKPTDEEEKLLNQALQLFNDILEKLRQKNINVQGFKATIVGNQLVITMPNSSLAEKVRDDFLSSLIKNNLLLDPEFANKDSHQYATLFDNLKNPMNRFRKPIPK